MRIEESTCFLYFVVIIKQRMEGIRNRFNIVRHPNKQVAPVWGRWRVSQKHLQPKSRSSLACWDIYHGGEDKQKCNSFNRSCFCTLGGGNFIARTGGKTQGQGTSGLEGLVGSSNAKTYRQHTPRGNYWVFSAL